MEHLSWFIGLLCCLLIRGTVSEKIGPAKVLSSNGQTTISAPPASRRPVRTTTVYGFLDFTTTIDNTEVVFRPSSASTASTSTSTIQSSRTLEPEVRNTRLANERLHQLNSKLRAQVLTASVTLVPDRPSASSSSRNKPPVIKTGQPSTDRLKSPRIVPTPTLGRATPSPPQGSSGGLPARHGTPSSLAEKRRRFLALTRRRPSGDLQSLPKAPARVRSSGSRDSPLLAALTRDDAPPDQEMAETIEVSPSKVKRFQEYTNLSTFFAVPGSTNGTRDRGRLLVRKLNRRPNGAEGGKSRLTAFRRAGPSNRPTFAGSRARAAENDEEPKVVASFAAATTATSSTRLEIVSSKPSEPSSATIAEYLHEADYALDAATINSVILPSLSAPAEENDADGPPPTTVVVPDLEGSQSDPGLQLVSSVSTESTTPLPVAVKKSAGIGDPGLTVPLQLSIVTSTFSLTETRLRTSLLPVYDGTSTTYYTLTHSFLVTKSVTTFQTVPPEEFMPYLIPGNNDSYYSINDVFDDFEDLPPHMQRKADVEGDEGTEATSRRDDPEGDGGDPPKELLEKSGTEHVTVQDVKDPKVDSPTPGPAYPMGNPLLGNLPFLNLLGPAAALGLNPYFPYGLGLPPQPQVVTTSRPVFSTDVVFTSKLLPIIDGLTTSYHTVREPASTVTHTTFETFTTQLAQQNPLGLGANNLGPNPLQHPGQQQVSTVTSAHTFVTTETQTATQVFKLMYDGYKTSYRTVSSSTLVTRTVSTFTTTTVPVYTQQQLLPFFG